MVKNNFYYKTKYKSVQHMPWYSQGFKCFMRLLEILIKPVHQMLFGNRKVTVGLYFLYTLYIVFELNEIFLKYYILMGNAYRYI